MKKIISLILAITLSFGMTACGSLTTDGTDSAAENNETSDAELSVIDSGVTEDGKISLTAAVTSDPGSLYPYGYVTGGKAGVRNMIYEPLFWPDGDGVLHPMLAKSYETDGNGVYDIELFDYIYDSEGNHLTAEDVVYSYNLFIEDAKNMDFIRGLVSFEATGEYTLRFVYDDEKIGDFNRTVGNVYIVTQAAWESSPDSMVDTPVGTGLYVLTDHIAGTSYTMEKRDDYWQTDESYLCQRQIANVDVFNLKIISDTSTIAVALENGEIDYTQNIVQADRSNFVNEDGTAVNGYVMMESANNNFIRLTFNAGENSNCSNVYLRQAICTAIDNAAICYNNEGVFGHACEASINPNLVDADASLNNTGDYYNYDPDAVAALLEKAGYNGETIRLLVQPNERTENAAIMIAAYCKEVNINVEAMIYENAQYLQNYADETGTAWDIVLQGVNTSTEGYYANIVTELDKSNYSNGLNGNYVDDATMQELYDRAASPAENSVEVTNELVQYVTEQCYSYGLYYYNVYWFGRDYIKEIVTDPAAGLSMYNAFVIER